MKATLPVFSKSLTYRPQGKLTILRYRVGNPANSNIPYGAGDGMEFEIPEFYLNEVPSVSIQYTPKPNDGAKIAQTITDFSNKGMIPELLRSLSDEGGMVPSIMTGNNTFKVVKEGAEISLTVKTRIYADEETDNHVLSLPNGNKNYGILLDTLLRLTLPSAATNVDAAKLAKDIAQVYSGVTNLPGQALGRLGEAGKEIDMKDVTGYVGSLAKSFGATVSNIFTEDPTKRKANKDTIVKGMEQAEATGGKVGAFVETLLKTFPSQLYKDTVKLEIRNGENNVINDLISKLEFRLESFDATQSSQTVGNSLYPVYMDFTLNLVSIGIPNNLWEFGSIKY